jgi:hypothetical protein
LPNGNFLVDTLFGKCYNQASKDRQKVMIMTKIANVRSAVIKNEDPDTDRVPHIIMQLRKSVDSGARNEILFKDGDRVRIPLRTIEQFFDVYAMLKPIDRESMQNLAAKSAKNFSQALIDFAQKEAAPRSIY